MWDDLCILPHILHLFQPEHYPYDRNYRRSLADQDQNGHATRVPERPPRGHPHRHPAAYPGQRRTHVAPALGSGAFPGGVAEANGAWDIGSTQNRHMRRALPWRSPEVMLFFVFSAGDFY